MQVIATRDRNRCSRIGRNSNNIDQHSVRRNNQKRTTSDTHTVNGESCQSLNSRQRSHKQGDLIGCNLTVLSSHSDSQSIVALDQVTSTQNRNRSISVRWCGNNSHRSGSLSQRDSSTVRSCRRVNREHRERVHTRNRNHIKSHTILSLRTILSGDSDNQVVISSNQVRVTRDRNQSSSVTRNSSNIHRSSSLSQSDSRTISGAGSIDSQLGKRVIGRKRGDINIHVISRGRTILSSHNHRNSVIARVQSGVTSHRSTSGSIGGSRNNRNRSGIRSNNQTRTVRNILTIDGEHRKSLNSRQRSHINSDTVISDSTVLRSNTNSNRVTALDQVGSTRNQNSCRRVSGNSRNQNTGRTNRHRESRTNRNQLSVHRNRNKRVVDTQRSHIGVDEVTFSRTILSRNSESDLVITLNQTSTTRNNNRSIRIRGHSRSSNRRSSLSQNNRRTSTNQLATNNNARQRLNRRQRCNNQLNRGSGNSAILSNNRHRQSVKTNTQTSSTNNRNPSKRVSSNSNHIHRRGALSQRNNLAIDNRRTIHGEQRQRSITRKRSDEQVHLVGCLRTILSSDNNRQ